MRDREQAERRFRLLQRHRRMAYQDWLMNGTSGWYVSVCKEMDALIAEIIDAGGYITCDGVVSVIVWGDENEAF